MTNMKQAKFHLLSVVIILIFDKVSNLEATDFSKSYDQKIQNRGDGYGQVKFRCPVPRNSFRRHSMEFNSESLESDGNDNDSLIRIIKLGEMNGRKVKVQFFYPNLRKPFKPFSRNSAEELSSDEVSTPNPTNFSGNETDIDRIGGVTAATGSGEIIVETTTTTSSFEIGRTGILTKENVVTDENLADIMCRWQFLAGNSTQYLLLTFNKMSAPYSNNCEDAYISMQKNDGYESRWCGNRRQGNGRPFALFSKTNATVSVFRRKNAPNTPRTGFSVIVETLENRAVNQAKDTFRILYRKIDK